MDSPSSNPSPQPLISDVSRSNSEETRGPSIKRSHSSEETISIEYPFVPQPSDHDALMAMDNQDHEYGCKYCNKKFTNKQALGGHQNAHKVERMVEKTTREAHENGLGYFGGPHFLPYHRSHDHLMSRSYLSLPNPSSHNGLSIGYSSSPAIPMPIEPFVPQPILRFGHIYGGLPATLQTHQRYPNAYIANHGLNYRFPNAREGSSNSARPVSEHHQGLSDSATTLRLEPSRIPGDGNNAHRMNQPRHQEVDELGLDLTLRL